MMISARGARSTTRRRRRPRCNPEVASLEGRTLLSHLAVFQPETSTFYIRDEGKVSFGQGRLYGGNPKPVMADYAGNGQPDLAVFQPSTSTFYIKGVGAVAFGQGTLYGGNPIPVPGHYRGHGKVELAVYQPTTSIFYIQNVGAIPFGQGTWYGGHPEPVTGDFDGDGTTDFGVYQPSTSTFYLHESQAGNVSFAFGQGTLYGGNPIPIVGDFDGDGKTDVGVYQPGPSTFSLHQSTNGNVEFAFGQGTFYGGKPDPVVGDVDNDGTDEIAVYQPSTSVFYVRGMGAIAYGQGTMYGGNPVPLTLQATGSSPGSDNTAPTTTADVHGNLGPNGWYTSPVKVHFNVSDPDDQSAALTIHESVDGGPWMTRRNLTLNQDGIHKIRYYATDPAGNAEARQTLTVKVDIHGPVISLSANPDRLWPPNHKTVPVTISGTVFDAGSGLNEPLHFTVNDEYNVADKSGTVVANANGHFAFTVDLISSRLGQDKDGRHYVITVTGTDNVGHTTTVSTVVLVPHDQGHGNGNGGGDNGNGNGHGNNGNHGHGNHGNGHGH